MVPGVSFIVLLSILFLCCVGALVLTGVCVNGFGAYKKKPYTIGILSAIIAVLLALALAYVLKLYPFALFWIFALIFILYGLIIKGITHKLFFSANGANRNNTLAGEFAYAMSIILFNALLFSAAEYFLFKERDFLFYPLLISFAAFLLPLLLSNTFKEARAIPPAYFPVWEYPELPKESPAENANEKLLVIGFEIAKRPTDGRNYFRARTPESILLGDLFYFFINDYNEMQSETPIKFHDHQNNPYEWWFRIKPRWYQGQRVLHPGKTVKENGVAENLVIICERLQMEDKL